MNRNMPELTPAQRNITILSFAIVIMLYDQLLRLDTWSANELSRALLH